MAEVRVRLSHDNLNGFLDVPTDLKALIIFVHGSGSGRFSRRNQYLAKFLNKNGYATLLIDLLTEKEKREDVSSEKFRFDIDLLTSRLVHITNSILDNPTIRNYPIVYFSSSTGTAAAINASQKDFYIKTIISRGGRVDLLSRTTIQKIHIPILFIVGEKDKHVINYSKRIINELVGTKLKELVIIPGANHFFEEEGKLEELSNISLQWLQSQIIENNHIFVNNNKETSINSFFKNFKFNFGIKFRDRTSAGVLLGDILIKYKNNNKIIILGISRGGVIVADGISDKLNPFLFDILTIQRLRSPDDPEETIGAIDKENIPYFTSNSLGISRDYLNKEISYQKEVIKRKLELYKPSYDNLDWHDKIVIIVDDGSYTGTTIIAASRHIKKYHPHRLIVAIPVIPYKTTIRLYEEVDTIEYLYCPKEFKTVEDYYTDFNQVKEEDIIYILKKRTRVLK